MRTFFITLLLVIVSFLSVFSQPKYEIRATWLTTLGGMDWPRNKAVIWMFPVISSRLIR